jgi:hypothetical protein
MTDHPLSSFAAYRKAWESVRPIRDEDDWRYMVDCWQNRSPAPNEQFIGGPAPYLPWYKWVDGIVGGRVLPPETPQRPDDNTPLRLEDAARWCPPGITVSTLRNEINNGNLPRCEFGGKLWLTLADIHHAMTKDSDTCAPSPDAAPRARGSTSNRRADLEASGDGSATTATPPGDDVESQRAAMASIASRLKASARKPTSGSARTSRNSRASSKVVPIK